MKMFVSHSVLPTEQLRCSRNGRAKVRHSPGVHFSLRLFCLTLRVWQTRLTRTAQFVICSGSQPVVVRQKRIWVWPPLHSDCAVYVRFDLARLIEVQE